MEPEHKSQKRASWVIPLVIIVALSAVATFLLNSWLNGNTTYISDGGSSETISYLSCTASAVSEPFFQPDNLVSAEHQVKITFKNDRPDDANYVFKGTFASGDWAKQADASMHAQYNIYMGNQKMNAEVLTPTFGHTEGVAQVSLYADKTEVNQATAPIFILSSEEANNFYNYSSDQISKIYNKKGFSCVLAK